MEDFLESWSVKPEWVLLAALVIVAIMVFLPCCPIVKNLKSQHFIDQFPLLVAGFFIRGNIGTGISDTISIGTQWQL